MIANESSHQPTRAWREHVAVFPRSIFQTMYAVQSPVTTSVAAARFTRRPRPAVTKRIADTACAALASASFGVAPVARIAPARSEARRSSRNTCPRLPIDADAAHALDGERLLEPAHLAQLARAARRGSGRRRRRHRRSARAAAGSTVSPSAAATASAFRSTPSAARQSSASCPPPTRAESFASSGPSSAEQHLRRRRPDRRRARARRQPQSRSPPRSAAGSSSAGQTWRERDAEGRRRRLLAVGDGERDEAAGDREGVDGDDPPADELLDEAVLAARLRERVGGRGGERPAGSAREPDAALAGAVGRLDDDRVARARRPPRRPRRACDRRASAAARMPASRRSRCFRRVTASVRGLRR